MNWDAEIDGAVRMLVASGWRFKPGVKAATINEAKQAARINPQDPDGAAKDAAIRALQRHTLVNPYQANA
jgi:hypothetical protein